MKEQNARALAVHVLDKVLYHGAYSNIALDHAFSSARLKSDDAALATEIVYGTLKYLHALDRIIGDHSKIPMEKMDPTVRNILRSAVYQLRYLDRVPDYAVINEAVEITKLHHGRASGFVNGVLRGVLRNRKSPVFRSPLEKTAFETSFPEWLVSFFQEQYGPLHRTILDGLNERPSVTFRVNTLRISREEALEKLVDLGYEAVPTRISPYGIEVHGGRSILDNPMHREGLLTVQDESSMMVGPLLAEQESKEYLDLCSAPGGKATQLAELTRDRTPIFAFDIYPNKLKRIEENVRRLGLTSIRTAIQDAGTSLPDHHGKASVLLDAPCSGLGIIRKKPEIKYTKTADDLKSLVELQRRLLRVAADYVGVGDVLVYSTCTLNKEENEENARWFLSQHPEFQAEPIHYGEDPSLLYTEEGFVTLLPGKTMDGFFLSRFKRVRK